MNRKKARGNVNREIKKIRIKLTGYFERKIFIWNVLKIYTTLRKHSGDRFHAKQNVIFFPRVHARDKVRSRGSYCVAPGPRELPPTNIDLEEVLEVHVNGEGMFVVHLRTTFSLKLEIQGDSTLFHPNSSSRKGPIHWNADLQRDLLWWRVTLESFSSETFFEDILHFPITLIDCSKTF